MKNETLEAIFICFFLMFTIGSLTLASIKIFELNPTKMQTASYRACEGLTPIWINKDTVICVHEHD
jgi:hypothetical protein